MLKNQWFLLGAILFWYFGIMTPLNVYGLFGSKEWITSVFETPRVLAFMASVGGLQALLLMSAIKPKLDLGQSILTVIIGTVAYYIFFGFFREGDWLNRIFNILLNTSFALIAFVLFMAFFKKIITFPRIIAILTASVVLVLNTILHIMLVNPVLDQIKDDRIEGVAEVVKRQDFTLDYCQGDHVYCFDYRDLVNMKEVIHLSEDDLVGINNFYESAPKEPGFNYQWEMSIPHTFYYRIIGVFIDKDKNMQVVISDKRDFRNLNIAIEDTTYFMTTSAGSTWMFIMFFMWWFHWRKGIGRNGRVAEGATGFGDKH